MNKQIGNKDLRFKQLPCKYIIDRLKLLFIIITFKRNLKESVTITTMSSPQKLLTFKFNFHQKNI